MNRKENKLKFSINGLTPTRISKFAIKKMFGELRTAALPRCERVDIVRSCVLQKGHKVHQTSKRRGEGANKLVGRCSTFSSNPTTKLKPRGKKK